MHAIASALDGSVRPDLPRGLLRLLGRLGPAAGDLAVLARVLAGALLELLDELLVRRDVDERIADLSGELRGTRLHRRDGDLDRLVGEVEDPRVLDRVVLPAVGLVAALPEKAHHLDRLLQQLEPLVRR